MKTWRVIDGELKTSEMFIALVRKEESFFLFVQRIVVYRDNFYIVVQFNKLTEESVDTA